MWPVVISAAIIAAAVALSSKKKKTVTDEDKSVEDMPIKCDSCSKILTSDKVIDAKELDFEYLSENPLKGFETICKECRDAHLIPYKRAVKDSEGIRAYSKNYRGRVFIENGCEMKTDWFYSKDDAERSLRVLAAYKGYDTVTRVDFVKDTRENWNNYIESVWQAKGVVGHGRRK